MRYVQNFVCLFRLKVFEAGFGEELFFKKFLPNDLKE